MRLIDRHTHTHPHPLSFTQTHITNTLHTAETLKKKKKKKISHSSVDGNFRTYPGIVSKQTQRHHQSGYVSFSFFLQFMFLFGVLGLCAFVFS